MPLWNGIRARETWIGVGAATLTVLLLNALGAWVIVGGIVPESWAEKWVCAVYVLAGALGTWIASGKGRGAAVRGLLICLLSLALIWVSSLLVSNGTKLSEGGWKLPAAVAAGCAGAVFLRTMKRGGAGKGHRKKRGGKRISRKR